MNLTKNDMARVIVQALFNIATLPAKDNIHVKRYSRGSKKHLENLHKKAVQIVLQQENDRQLAN